MMERMILEFAKRNVREVGRGIRSLFLIDPTRSGMSMVDELDVEDEVWQSRSSYQCMLLRAMLVD